MIQQLKEKFRKRFSSSSHETALPRPPSSTGSRPSNDGGCEQMMRNSSGSRNRGKWVDEDAEVSKEDFMVIKSLGKGAFSEVCLVRRNDNQKLYALKMIDKRSALDRDWVKRIHVECAALKRVNHPYIVKMEQTFQSEHKLFFVLEYFDGGDLDCLLRRVDQGRVSEDHARFYGAEIYSALQYLHDLNIIYRDLKPQNVMLNKEGHVHLVDLGLCSILDIDEEDQDQDGEDVPPGEGPNCCCPKRCASFVGTPAYVAPEILRKAEYGFQVDWWSFGVFLFQLMCGTVPFRGESIQQVLDHILHVWLKMEAYPWLSNDAKSLLASLLEKHDVRRICGRSIQEHPFYGPIDWDRLNAKQLPPPPLPIPVQTLSDPLSPVVAGPSDQPDLDPKSPLSPVLMTDVGIGASVKKPSKNSFLPFSKPKHVISPRQQELFSGFTCRSPETTFANPCTGEEAVKTSKTDGLSNFQL